MLVIISSYWNIKFKINLFVLLLIKWIIGVIYCKKNIEYLENF